MFYHRKIIIQKSLLDLKNFKKYNIVTMFKNVLDFTKKHTDFKIYKVTWIPIIIAILIYPAIKYLPEKYGYENGILENTQLVFLVLSCIFGFCTKSHKKFFKFTALVSIILILREVNCGRTIFFPVPDAVNTFYSWKEIKYGWLAHPLYGLYMAGVGVYFIINKLYLDLFKYIKCVKLPVWNIVFLLIGMGIGMYSEKVIDNMLLEEMTEMLFYASLMSIIWLYAFNKNFKIKENENN